MITSQPVSIKICPRKGYNPEQPKDSRAIPVDITNVTIEFPEYDHNFGLVPRYNIMRARMMYKPLIEKIKRLQCLQSESQIFMIITTEDDKEFEIQARDFYLEVDGRLGPVFQFGYILHHKKSKPRKEEVMGP